VTWASPQCVGTRTTWTTAPTTRPTRAARAPNDRPANLPVRFSAHATRATANPLMAKSVSHSAIGMMARAMRPGRCSEGKERIPLGPVICMSVTSLSGHLQATVRAGCEHLMRRRSDFYDIHRARSVAVSGGITGLEWNVLNHESTEAGNQNQGSGSLTARVNPKQ
jgi:hypothetical protein